MSNSFFKNNKNFSSEKNLSTVRNIRKNSSSTRKSSTILNKVNLNLNSCKHKFVLLENKIPSNSSKKLFEKFCFCEFCKGLIILIDDCSLYTVSFFKNKKFIFNNLVNPLILLNEMQKSDLKENLTLSNIYFKKRKDMINFIAKLKNKYKLSNDSYFLAINLLDLICSKLEKIEVDLELLTISCFFLAGNFKYFLYY